LSYFDGSVSKAVQNTFPDIPFDFKGKSYPILGANTLIFTWLATHTPKNYWKDINNCKNFFLNYAEEKGLDVSVVNSWYSVDLKELLQRTVAC
jgi:hypothetical protein